MKVLAGKSILLISLTEYSSGIIDELQRMGANVDYMCDKPNNSLICKSLGRLKVRLYMKVIEHYYYKMINQYSKNRYDYILVIRGEYTPINSIKYLKKVFSSSRLILYMWDSLKNNKGIQKKWTYFDKVYTFDRKDYLNNKEQLSFLPLFYYGSFVPDKVVNYRFDIAFIGTGHMDRVDIIKKVKAQCLKYNFKMYDYIYLPHKLIYLKNKVFNRNYKGVKIGDINFKMIPINRVYEIYSEAKCVVDVESPNQTGLTMRTIEMIGLRKKLITTNQDIVNYDFYDPDNIMVVDRKKIMLDSNFINRPYKQLSEEIYKKYSLYGWIMQLLEVEK